MLLTLLLLMLTLFSYSLGTTLGARRKDTSPWIVDLLIVVVLWAILLLTPAIRDSWMLIVGWILAVLVVGAIHSTWRYANVKAKPAPPDYFANAGILRRGWEQWKVLAAEIGHFQGLMIMGFFYFTILAPFGLGARLFSDQLKIKSKPSQTGWNTFAKTTDSLESAKSQF